MRHNGNDDRSLQPYRRHSSSPPHVVGLSLGGMTATRLAARHPGRFERLVLLCTSALLGLASMWSERAALVRAQGTAAVAESVVGRWFTAAVPARDPDLVQRMRAMVAAPPAEGYAGCCDAIAAMDLRADLPRVAVPTLAIAAQVPVDPTGAPRRDRRGGAGRAPARRPRRRPSRQRRAARGGHGGLLTHLDLAGPPPGDHAGDHARREQGMGVRRAVLGDAHVDRAVAGPPRFTAPFQDLITCYAWGDVWSRPGLDRRTRSMLTLALLTALGQEHELAMHVRSALTNGVAPAEVGEVLLHSAVYTGVPAANRAFAVAQEVLAGLGVDLATSTHPDPVHPTMTEG